MNFLDIFKPKPKICASCGNPVSRFHTVISFKPEIRLCTNCLLSQLVQQIHGKKIIFFEPFFDDGFTYISFEELIKMVNPVAKERLMLAMASIGSSCAVCEKPASHLWLPQDDLDDAAMENQPENSYWQIPLIPAQWKGTLSLCDEHAVEKLGELIERKHYYFLNFRFPGQSQTGYYGC